jgi:single-stranded-DNA-specific exonuclease
MPRILKHWQIAPPLPPDVKVLLSSYPEQFKQILYNRGHSTPLSAEEYLNAELPPGTDPFKLNGMPKAVYRLGKAIQNSETIAIYGDYDVDGAATAANSDREVGGSTGHIPNRFDEGYGFK